jgi:hypothetical protein
MFKLFWPSKSLGSLLSLILLCLNFTARAQDDSLGSEVEEFQNLQDATLDESALEESSPATEEGRFEAVEPPPAALPPPSELPEEDSSGQNDSEQDAAGEITTERETVEQSDGAQDAEAEATSDEDTAERNPADTNEEKSELNEPKDSSMVATPVGATSVEDSQTKSDESGVDPQKASDQITVGTYGGRIFGQHKIQLAANRPNFIEGQKCYEKFYGKPETHISFSGEWFPLDWWVNPGLYTRLGVYSVRGKAISGSPSDTQTANCESLSVDENSSTSLLFVPIQVGAKIQFSPFRRKWLVVDYWAGAELDWWQETRNETASMVSLRSLTSSGQVYTTTGRKRSISTGASVHLLLNPLDEKTVRSMIETMGLGYVYLSGFMETVKSTSQEGLTFGRNVLGIGFTFEAYK